MKTIQWLTMAVALAGGTAAATAAETTFAEAFSGKPFPLTLRLQDLDESWRRVTLSAGVEGFSAASVYRALLTGSLGPGVYYTKGQTITLAGENYLVAYRAQSKQGADVQAMAMAMRGGGGAMPEPEKPTPQTTLCLALLNLRTTGSFNDIRAFNLDAELTGGEAGPATEEDRRAKEVGEASLKNLRKLGTAVLTYERERRVLPLLTDAKTAQEELILYVAQRDVFAQPDTKKPYAVNASLSGRKLADVANPERMPVFFEPAAGSDGARAVLFLDGHAERVTEQQWKRIRQDSGL